MAFIELISDDEATGLLKRIYDGAIQRAGKVAHIIRVMCLDAKVNQASIGFYVQLMKTDNALSKPHKEMLATVVSNINDCYY